MGMTLHDNYYQPDETFDNRQFQVEEEAWSMMQRGKKWDYRTTQAIAEAMAELDIKQDADLQAMIDTNDYEKIGRKIMMIAHDYMEKFALDDAGSE